MDRGTQLEHLGKTILFSVFQGCYWDFERDTLYASARSWHHWFVLILSTNIYFAEMFRKRKSYVPNFLAVVGHFPKSWLWPYFTLRQKVWRDILFYRKQKASISRVTEVPDSIFTKDGVINIELRPIEHIFNWNNPLETLSEEILFTSGYTVKKETCG